MVLFGVLTVDQAIAAIDFNTIALLLGMMILVSALKMVGFFGLLAARSLAIAGTPRRLLAVVVVATAVASAFLVNDAVVLLFTPIIIQACRLRRIDPVPYLIAEAMASNIGSTATIVGNPQNMLIGITSGISFTRFFLHLLPVSVLSALVLLAVMLLLYRKQMQGAFAAAPAAESPLYDHRAIGRLAPILALVLVAFFLSSLLNISIPMIALASAAVVLLAGGIRPSLIIREVDWVLLLFFAGLFVVIEGAHRSGVLDVFIQRVVLTPNLGGIASVAAVSTVVSQIVSNVPLTMLLLPVLKQVPGDVLWIALAAGSTLGGNLTIIGAVANIIVVEVAYREGVRVGFSDFLKVGAVVTVATVALSVLVLDIEYWAGWLL